MRKIKFANSEYYHIFNRGVDKRKIFSSENDFLRFFQSITEFNTIDPIGSLYENSFRLKNKSGKLMPKKNKNPKLVDFICYCLHSNHYHFLLKQVSNNGIEKFMHRIGTGYTKYFNKKYDRSGSLFQGTYKAIHIESDVQLLHTSAYINLNARVHKLENSDSKSSWKEYTTQKMKGFCIKNAILGQFNFSSEDYKAFAEKSLRGIKIRKGMEDVYIE